MAETMDKKVQDLYQMVKSGCKAIAGISPLSILSKNYDGLIQQTIVVAHDLMRKLDGRLFPAVYQWVQQKERDLVALKKVRMDCLNSLDRAVAQIGKGL